jgi:hypothetical protein
MELGFLSFVITVGYGNSGPEARIVGLPERYVLPGRVIRVEGQSREKTHRAIVFGTRVVLL